MLHYTFLLLQSTACDTAALTNSSFANNVRKHKHLKYPWKKTALSKGKVKHQPTLSYTNGNGIDQGTNITDECHQATGDAIIELTPEQESEGCEKHDEANSDNSRVEEGKRSSFLRTEVDEKGVIDEQENVTGSKEGQVNEECEGEKEGNQEECKRSTNDNERSRAESCTDRMSCNQSDSGVPSNQPNYSEPENIKMTKEVDQHTEGDTHGNHQTDTEWTEPTPGLCEMPQTSGIGSDDQCQRQQELQKENLRLSSENVELRFQLEQANKDLPRLKDQVSALKEMCELLKREKAEVERKLGSVRGSGRSGKTVPELEKTIGLMKKVVEKVQRENEDLKKAPGVVSNEKLVSLELENERLKSEMEKLKLHLGGQLSMRYESKTRGMEKIIAENERLCKELKKEADTAEKLRIAKNSIEIINEKLTVELEETVKRLNLAESRGPQLKGADGKSWKSIVVTRMYETKMKELEIDIAQKNQSITDLKQLLREATEREHNIEKHTQDLKEQIELLKHFPEGAKTEQGLARELQLLRLTNNRLQKEKAELAHQLEAYRHPTGINASEDSAAEKGRNDKLTVNVIDLQTQLQASDLEKQQLKEEIKQLKRELENFDPSFFEEIEDLKYNYNEEVKNNIILEEKLKKLSEQFGVQVDIPANVSID